MKHTTGFYAVHQRAEAHQVELAAVVKRRSMDIVGKAAHERRPQAERVGLHIGGWAAKALERDTHRVLLQPIEREVARIRPTGGRGIGHPHAISLPHDLLKLADRRLRAHAKEREPIPDSLAFDIVKVQLGDEPRVDQHQVIGPDVVAQVPPPAPVILFRIVWVGVEHVCGEQHTHQQRTRAQEGERSGECEPPQGSHLGDPGRQEQVVERAGKDQVADVHIRGTHKGEDIDLGDRQKRAEQGIDRGPPGGTTRSGES